jgi:DNA-binding MarR family transcriptional regulator
MASMYWVGDVGRDIEQADRLARQLHRLVRAIERTRAQAAAIHADGVERACIGLLSELVDHGPMRLTALAEAVFADPSTVSRQVAQLVELGLAERQPDPKDGRASRLAATERGTDLLAQRRRRRSEHIADMMARWPVADRQRLIDLLKRFNDDFERYRPRMLAHDPGGPEQPERESA